MRYALFMTFDEYQKIAITTDTFEEAEKSIVSPSFMSKLLGLVGETGEIAEKFKKIYRDNDGVMSDEQVLEIRKELGDVLWYINAMSCYLGFTLEDVAQDNLKKVLSRKQRGKTHGSGDNR